MAEQLAQAQAAVDAARAAEQQAAGRATAAAAEVERLNKAVEELRAAGRTELAQKGKDIEELGQKMEK